MLLQLLNDIDYMDAKIQTQEKKDVHLLFFWKCRKKVDFVIASCSWKIIETFLKSLASSFCNKIYGGLKSLKILNLKW